MNSWSWSFSPDFSYALKKNVAHEFCADNSSSRPQFPKQRSAALETDRTSPGNADAACSLVF
jgi:hypothetical protein